MGCGLTIGVRLTRRLELSTPVLIQMVTGGSVRTNCRHPAARLGSRLVSQATVRWRASLMGTRFSFPRMGDLGDQLLSGTTGARDWALHGQQPRKWWSVEATVLFMIR